MKLAFFLEQALWSLTSVAMALLLFFLIAHKSYRAFPAFCSYIAVSLLQGVTLFVVYRMWSFSSPIAWRMGWITQFFVLGARAGAVIELCRSFLVRFRGIWALASRVLLVSAVSVLACALIAARHEWRLALTTLEIAVELTIASAIVLLLIFVRYYQVPAEAPLRSLAAGLCLYSCISVANDAVLERFLAQYVSSWNVLSMAAFLACVVLWIFAFRTPVVSPAKEHVYVDRSLYLKVAPEVNSRLRLLNEQLAKFWNVEAPLP